MNLDNRRTALKRRLARLLLFVSSAALAAGEGRADAAFPGENGNIAFSRSVAGVFQIFTVDPDGAGETQLTFGSTHAFGPSWSPDGLQLAFCRNFGIVVTNADGANAREVATTASCSLNSNTAWSPDGRQIAFSSAVGVQAGLSVADVDGSGFTQIVTGYVATRPSWSPDGTKIAFGGVKDDEAGIYLVNPDGSSLTLITAAGSHPENSFPDWSPDGDEIVFTTLPAGDFANDIFIMNADGSNPVPVTTTFGVSETTPTWSPDGTKIAFFRLGGIYVMDSSGEVQITTGFAPAWQPRGGSQTVFADLTLTLAGSGKSANTKKPFAYTITIGNNGPDTAAGVIVTDTLDPHAQFQSATPSQGSCTVTPAIGATGMVECDLGALGVSDVATVEIVVTLPSKNSFGSAKPMLANLAFVAGSTADALPGNNTATLVTTVVGP